MRLTLRYLYSKSLEIDSTAQIADDCKTSLEIEWLSASSSLMACRPGFLYFITDMHESPSPANDIQGTFAYIVPKSLTEECRGIPRIAVSDDCDFSRLFEFLVEEMERYRRWHERICNSIASDAPYQDIVDETARLIPRPMYIGDARWRMISSVDFDMCYISATWHYQKLHDGLYPYNIVEALNRTGDYSRISNLPRATLIDSEVYTMRILAKPIRHLGKLVGYFFIIDTWGDLGFCEVEIAEEFGTMIAPLMATRETRDGSLAGFQDYFISLILKGMLAGKQDVSQSLALETHWRVESDYRLATVLFSPNELQNHLLQMRIMGMLKGHFDCRAYFFENSVVAVFHMADSNLDAFLRHLEECASKLKRIVVLSCRFRDFSKLKHHYDKNVRIVSQIAPGDIGAARLITCDSMFDRLLAECCTEHLLGCYEADLLHSYDNEHQTNYCETLYAYLLHERNAIATANALYIHRNTLRNRLEKICEIVDLDLEDPDVRIRIIISLNTIMQRDAERNGEKRP